MSAVIIMATSGTNSKGKVNYFLGFYLCENSWECTIQSALKEYLKRRSFHRKKISWILQISVEFARLNHLSILGFSKFTELNSHKKLFLA